MLRITIKPTQFRALGRFISSFPNVKVLILHIFCQGRIDVCGPGSVDNILPDVGFQHLQSFWLSSNTNSVSTCLDKFIGKQPSLLELYLNHSFRGPKERFFALGPPSRLRALNVTSVCFGLRPPQGNRLSLLSMIRIKSLINLSSQWVALLNGLPRLECLEISSPMTRVTDFGDEQADQTSLSQFKKDIIELGIVRPVQCGTATGVSVQEACTSVERLVSFVPYDRRLCASHLCLRTVYLRSGRLSTQFVPSALHICAAAMTKLAWEYQMYLT